MKKLLLLVGLAGILAVGCKKDEIPPLPEIALSKEVQYHVYAAQDYSAPYYQGAKAALRLQILKTNYQTGVTEFLFDTVFTTRNLMDFPQLANKIVIQKTFPVFESKEKLTGAYSIKYDFNGLTSQEGQFDDLGPGKTTARFEVDL